MATKGNKLQLIKIKIGWHKTTRCISVRRQGGRRPGARELTVVYVGETDQLGEMFCLRVVGSFE